MSNSPVNNDRTASEVGLNANQPDKSLEDKEFDKSSYAGRAPTYVNTGSSTFRPDAELDYQAVDAYHKINAILEDGGDWLTEEFGIQTGLKNNQNQQYYQGNYAQQSNQDYSDLLDGIDDTPAMGGARTNQRWQVIEAVGTTKSGKKIPVWLVKESASGMQYPTTFKIEEVAHRIANAINQTGDFSHPSVSNINETYKQRDSLHTKAKKLREAVKRGQQEYKPTLIETVNKLQALDAKLGI